MENAPATIIPPEENTFKGNFTITEKTSYVSNGNTIYVMTGNFTLENGTILSNILIVFNQANITATKEWILVVIAQVNDILEIQAVITGDVNYAIQILQKY